MKEMLGFNRVLKAIIIAAAITGVIGGSLMLAIIVTYVVFQ